MQFRLQRSASLSSRCKTVNHCCAPIESCGGFVKGPYSLSCANDGCDYLLCGINPGHS